MEVNFRLLNLPIYTMEFWNLRQFWQNLPLQALPKSRLSISMFLLSLSREERHARLSHLREHLPSAARINSPLHCPFPQTDWLRLGEALTDTRRAEPVHAVAGAMTM